MLNATGADQVILNSDGTIEDIEFIGMPKKD